MTTFLSIRGSHLHSSYGRARKLDLLPPSSCPCSFSLQISPPRQPFRLLRGQAIGKPRGSLSRKAGGATSPSSGPCLPMEGSGCLWAGVQNPKWVPTLSFLLPGQMSSTPGARVSVPHAINDPSLLFCVSYSLSVWRVCIWATCK